jgi:hypothetical protein
MNPHRLHSGFRAALVFGALLALSTAPARAADTLFTVSGIKVDATAASATEARDNAIAQGRPIAWTKLFRRLARDKDWPRQPQLDDQTLLHMIRGIEIANEKRSSTRYLAEITYDFNPADVRRILQQAGVAYTETAAKRVLVIPVVAGAAKPYDLAGAWTKAWAATDLADSVLPMVLPSGGGGDMDVLARSDLAQLGWATFAPLATHYDASEVLIAQAVPTQGAVTVTLVRVTPTGSTSAALAAQPNFATAAQAAATSVREAWKGRAAINYGQRSKLTVLVSFSSGSQWAAMRTSLAIVPTVADVSVVALSLNKAQIELSYVGQLQQLQDTLAQQGFILSPGPGMYSLRTATAGP